MYIMDRLYLVAIVGKDVYQNFLEFGLMRDLSYLNKVRKFLYNTYNIEFEELSACFTSSSWKFTNITDNRDITLYVKRLPIFK